MNFDFIFNIYNELQQSVETIDILSTIDKLLTVGLNVILIIGGICGISYLAKLKNKEREAIFGYYTQLKVRIQYLYDIFDKYHDDILSCFIPPQHRKPWDASKAMFIQNIINQFADCASETLLFLKKQDNQVPASLGWSKKYSLFLSFLTDCELIKNKNYYKWVNDYDVYTSKYLKTHKENMESMIKDISSKQLEIEEKLYSTSIFSFFKRKKTP